MDNLRQILQVFSCFYEKFKNQSVAFTLSTFMCYPFILSSYYCISFHKDDLKMNKNSLQKLQTESLKSYQLT